MRFASLAVVLLLALLASATLHTVAGKANDNTFDYFYLVRQWPATFCNDHSCTHKPPRRFAFTVHGLWPQRDDGTWPEFCNPTDHLQLRQIWDLLPFLAYYWPSWSSDNKAFWDHEWTRHGTCSKFGSQHAFFKAVLKLHRSLNIQDALTSADIEPSATHRYPVSTIEDAIIKKHGVKPHVTCDYEGNLAEVWMCIGLDLTPVDCTDGPHPHAQAAGSPKRVSSSSSIQNKKSKVGGSSRNVRAGASPNQYCKYVRIPPLRGSGSTSSASQQALLQLPGAFGWKRNANKASRASQ